MSQRNPMNERYTTEKKRAGNSRKSAASAKPKSTAAASVVQGTKKKKKAVSRTDKRAQKREARNKEFEAERKYGDPPGKKFKLMRKLWIGFLIASVVTVALSFVANKIEGAPDWLAMAFLIAAYVCIIATLYLDLGKIRRMRKEYAAKMAAAQTKESRAEQKRRKAAQRKAEKEAEEKRIEDEKKRAQEKSTRAGMSFAGKVKSFLKVKK